MLKCIYDCSPINLPQMLHNSHKYEYNVRADYSFKRNVMKFISMSQNIAVSLLDM